MLVSRAKLTIPVLYNGSVNLAVKLNVFNHTCHGIDIVRLSEGYAPVTLSGGVLRTEICVPYCVLGGTVSGKSVFILLVLIVHYERQRGLQDIAIIARPQSIHAAIFVPSLLGMPHTRCFTC